ncbi:MAG TPA: DciA family protein [Rhodocyclaceae bacterium]|nr:DciA family protein [Rhodocyclaceae bacterium]
MADAGLARLSGHARRLLRLQRVFESATPLARQARVANFKLGKIIIHAVNGAVAAKLKQMEPRLAAVFRSEAAEVTGIDIRVQPDVDRRQAEPPRIRTGMGEEQKRALTSLADDLPEGSALRTALTRLVDRS